MWVCARTSEDLENCLAEYASATWSGSIHGSVCDVSVAEDRKQLMAQVALRFSSKLDILVNLFPNMCIIYVLLSVKENHNSEKCSIDVYDLSFPIVFLKLGK